jgi:hypothetical protein
MPRKIQWILGFLDLAQRREVEEEWEFALVDEVATVVTVWRGDSPVTLRKNL